MSFCSETRFVLKGRVRQAPVVMVAQAARQAGRGAPLGAPLVAGVVPPALGRVLAASLGDSVPAPA